MPTGSGGQPVAEDQPGQHRHRRGVTRGHRGDDAHDAGGQRPVEDDQPGRAAAPAGAPQAGRRWWVTLRTAGTVAPGRRRRPAPAAATRHEPEAVERRVASPPQKSEAPQTSAEAVPGRPPPNPFWHPGRMASRVRANDPYDPRRWRPCPRSPSTAPSRPRARLRRRYRPRTRSPPPARRTPATARRCCWPAASSARCRPAPAADAGKRVNAGARRGHSGLRRAAGRARGRARRAGAGRGARRRHAALGPHPARRPAPDDHADPERIADVFVGMGWEVAEGPELEAEWLNFDALNIGPDHPARATAGHLLSSRRRASGLVLRTHTSPGAGAHDARAHARRSTSSPRARSTAPTSSTRPTRPVFHQVEGLVVDEG